MQTRLLIALLASGLIAAGCSQGQRGGEPEATSSAAATQPAGQLVLDEARLSNIHVEPVAEKDIRLTMAATGKVQFNEDRTSIILAPIAGQVLQLSAKVGDTVRSGQTLFYINSREVAASIDEYQEAKKDLELAEKTCKMNKQLAEHQAVSTIAVQQSDNDLSKARSKVARIGEQLRILDVNGDGVYDTGELNPRIPIKSPIAGTVVERHVTERQYVQGDSTALMIIADLSSVWVAAEVFERDLRLVRVGQRAEVTTLAYPDEIFTARVEQIGSVVDPTSRTVKVRFLVSNPDLRLKPEMFADIRLFLADRQRAVTLPPKAVYTEGGENFVFVNVRGHEFVNRSIRVAPLADGSLRVLAGLNPGDRVVTEGALLLRAQQSNTGNEDVD